MRPISLAEFKKMKTRLNMCQACDLSLYGRTLLPKTIGASQLINAPSMLSVPENIIQKTQAELFAFLWRNTKDKIKRKVVYDANWKTIPNYYLV